ncbi:hypothetical protein Emag_000216 [Eimeria magna]
MSGAQDRPDCDSSAIEIPLEASPKDTPIPAHASGDSSLSPRRRKRGRVCLLVVDAQYDFCEGALAAPEGRNGANAASCEELATEAAVDDISLGRETPGSSSRQTGSPREEGGGCKGAKLHPAVEPQVGDFVVRKATLSSEECFSACGTTRQPTGLIPLLQAKGVETVAICGFCLDYCVAATAVPLRAAGIPDVVVLTDFTAAIHQEKQQQTVLYLGAHKVSSKPSATWARLPPNDLLGLPYAKALFFVSKWGGEAPQKQQQQQKHQQQQQQQLDPILFQEKERETIGEERHTDIEASIGGPRGGPLTIH